MSNTEKSLAKSFVIFVLLVGIGVCVTLVRQPRSSSIVKAVSVASAVAAEISVYSSTSDKKLTLRTTQRPDGTTQYIYSIAGRVLFDKTLPAGASMGLPVNSWDPTDTYVCLEEHNSGAVDYVVMKADGTPFADGNPFIDVGAVWANKDIGYTIRTATGWASGTLLIIYTSNSDGSRGPAFWFEIPSTAIIQLAS